MQGFKAGVVSPGKNFEMFCSVYLHKLMPQKNYFIGEFKSSSSNCQVNLSKSLILIKQLFIPSPQKASNVSQIISLLTCCYDFRTIDISRHFKGRQYIEGL